MNSLNTVPEELYSLVYHFLKDTGHNKSAKSFKKESKKPFHENVKTERDLIKIITDIKNNELGKSKTKQARKDNQDTENNDSDSSSESSESNESNESSSESGESSNESIKSSNKSIKSSSESSSESSSSSEDESSESDHDSSNDTESSGKSTIQKSQNSTSSSDTSSSSDSTSSSDDSSDSTSSSDDSSSNESDEEKEDEKVNHRIDSEKSSDEDDDSDIINIFKSNDSKKDNSSEEESSDSGNESSSSENKEQSNNFNDSTNKENPINIINNDFEDSESFSTIVSQSDTEKYTCGQNEFKSEIENDNSRTEILDSKCNIDFIETPNTIRSLDFNNEGHCSDNEFSEKNGNNKKHKISSDNYYSDQEYSTPCKRPNTNISETPSTIGKSPSWEHFIPNSVLKNKKNNKKFIQKGYQPRVDPNRIEFLDERLKDNSFMAKEGAIGSYGEKAHNDFMEVRGKNFRAQKTKKKRGSYRGGKIDMESHSIKFQD
ncbi:hypothetical protein Glove_104g51 [Diversispora epigaea]|uniref:Srp40 C-terminal domain-containing protein n=1 Tax=Diversispora epigaea TaxID=1348612 RepID=A0A397JC21_9GLOM|nr:hypothetical protein Glove_104g51 [Diversispora epigaea]